MIIMIKLIMMLIMMITIMIIVITNDRSGLGRVGGSRKHGNPYSHQLGGS